MNKPLLEVCGLSHTYRINRRQQIRAVQEVSFCMERCEIFGLVGESGCGKSTVAKCVMNLCRPTAGVIRFNGINICDRAAFAQHRTMLQQRRQIIFQDSASSLNRRMRVADIVAEPLQIHRIAPPRGSLRAEAAFQLHHVGLDASCLDKYPFELSGGQRQRVAIARALSMEPELLVADEPVASLDASVRAQIINLFSHLRAEHGVSILFIAHDLAMVRHLCDRVGVMHGGRLVELAPAAALFDHPQHPYTRALLSAMTPPDPRMARSRPRIEFDAATACGSTMREIADGHHVLLQEELS